MPPDVERRRLRQEDGAANIESRPRTSDNQIVTDAGDGGLEQSVPSPRVPGDPVTLAEAVGGLLEWSDAMDAQLTLRLAAFREGWRAAEQAHAGDYDLGFVDGLLRRKRMEHDEVDAAELEARRWGRAGRAHFADPRPGDFPGRGTA